MDKTIAGLLGSASALALIGSTAPLLAAPVGPLQPAETYAELLDPIPNAAELVRNQNQPAALIQLTQFYYGDQRPYYRHHHHHTSSPSPPLLLRLRSAILSPSSPQPHCDPVADPGLLMTAGFRAFWAWRIYSQLKFKSSQPGYVGLRQRCKQGRNNIRPLRSPDDPPRRGPIGHFADPGGSRPFEHCAAERYGDAPRTTPAGSSRTARWTIGRSGWQGPDPLPPRPWFRSLSKRTWLRPVVAFDDDDVGLTRRDAQSQDLVVFNGLIARDGSLIVEKPASSGGRALYRGDVQFNHLSHGGEDASRHAWVRVGQEAWKKTSGTICQGTPHLSRSHPHMISEPPSAVSAIHSRHTGRWMGTAVPKHN